MKILLANDTGRMPHVGCQAVSDGHARLLGRAGHDVVHRLFRGVLGRFVRPADSDIVRAMAEDEALVAMIDEADAVVVNGEGTLHHGAGRDLLGLLALAQNRGKASLLVNTGFQGTDGFADTLARLDDFVVREPRSQAAARARGLDARIEPDSYLAARFEAGPSDALAGKEVVTDWQRQREDVGAALDSFRLAHADSAVVMPLRFPEAARDWAAMPAAISRCRLLVTARHHGVYLAIVAGVPFIAMGSNTHKVEGTLEMLELKDLFCEAAAELEPARARALADPERFKGLRKRLNGGGLPDPFRALGSRGPEREAAEVRKLRADVAAAAAAEPGVRAAG